MGNIEDLGFFAKDLIVAKIVHRVDKKEVSKSQRKAVPLAHIDYPNSQTQNVKNLWTDWSVLKDRFPNTEDSELYGFFSNNIGRFVNIWIPLNSRPSSSTLAILDPHSLRKESSRIVEVSKSSGGHYSSYWISYDNEQQWYADPSLSRGQALIFYSDSIPHASVVNPSSTIPRQSIELRVFYSMRKFLTLSIKMIVLYLIETLNSFFQSELFYNAYY